MANEEQLSILKQGVDVWNKWRTENRHTLIELDNVDLSFFDLDNVNFIDVDLQRSIFQNANLQSADFRFANLKYTNFKGANLMGSNFDEVNLEAANLKGANLQGCYMNQSNLNMADLTKADFQRANLQDSDLSAAQLVEANLNGASLNGADLSGTDLTGSSLIGATLIDAKFYRAYLAESRFENALMGQTKLAHLDLSATLGLKNVKHQYPSSVSTDTLYLSKGILPDVFLQGCGLSDWEIESSKLYNPGLNNEEVNAVLYKMYSLRVSQALQISPLFISYSHVDKVFVDKVESHLNKKGIRFWRDIHDMKSGRIEKQIGEAIRLNPTVLLILSNHSLQSDWVEHEVRTARALEKEMKRDVLCPVAVDDGWKNSPWAKRIMEQIMEYNILDFSEWMDDEKFESAFNKLIDGLELFYK